MCLVVLAGVEVLGPQDGSLEVSKVSKVTGTDGGELVEGCTQQCTTGRVCTGFLCSVPGGSQLEFVQKVFCFRPTEFAFSVNVENKLV